MTDHRTHKTTVCIIPAHSGSKGIAGKHMADFCGRPLLYWTMMQAKSAATVDYVVVSSDHPVILDAARDAGCTGLAFTPEHSTDTATFESAINHALEQCPHLGIPDPETVVFLQASSPLRLPTDIDRAVARYHADRYDSLFSCSQADELYIWNYNARGDLQRITDDAGHEGQPQYRPSTYLENGSIYALDAKGFLKTGSRRFGRIGLHIMPLWQSLQIDVGNNLEVCRDLFRRHLQHLWCPVHEIGLSIDDIDLIVYDFDGVMTDNRALVMESGDEGVMVNRADGMGINRLKKNGIDQMIMSTESNPVVQARGDKLGIETLAPVADKGSTLATICRQRGIDPKRVVFFGNDLNDADAMAMVGYPVAPSDAHPDIRDMACIVTNACGGAGVIRELADGILAAGDYRAQNRR